MSSSSFTLHWAIYRRINPSAIQRLATGSDPVDSPAMAIDRFQQHLADWMGVTPDRLPPLVTDASHRAWACYDDATPTSTGLLADGILSPRP